MICRHCRQDAPLVYRGLFAYCSACNAPRRPLSGPAVNLAGAPFKVGGSVGMFLGWLILGGGLVLATAVILVLRLLLPAEPIGYVIGLPLALLSLVMGLALLVGSKRLRTSGANAEHRIRSEAIHALVRHRGGAITAEDAARSLGIERAEADALLTKLTETDPENVRLEVDDDGNLFYVFAEAESKPRIGEKYRVDPSGRVRVSDPFLERLGEIEEERRTSVRR